MDIIHKLGIASLFKVCLMYFSFLLDPRVDTGTLLFHYTKKKSIISTRVPGYVSKLIVM